jgi:hypothetical protein
MNLIHWEKFLEAKKNGHKLPPQGNGAAPYCAPHATNDGKVKIRVAEKSKETAFGDQATPSLKDPKKNHPVGQRPSYKDVVAEAKKVFNGKLNDKVPAPGDPDPAKNKHVLRGLKSDGEGFADKGCSCFKKPTDIAPLHIKPTKSSLTTEQFIKQTAKLSDAEFVQAMLNEAVAEEEAPRFEPVECALTGKKFFPTAHEAARYMAHLLPENGRARRILINELKATPGGMGALMKELVGHGETYDEMVNQIGLGEEKVAQRFVKAMQESHDKFMTEMGLMGESVNIATGQRFRPHGQDGQGPSQGQAPDQGQETGPEDGPPPEMGDEDPAALVQDVPGDGTGSVDAVPPEQGADSPMAKLKKEFAYHHMVREMSHFPNMVEVMREQLM